MYLCWIDDFTLAKYAGARYTGDPTMDVYYLLYESTGYQSDAGTRLENIENTILYDFLHNQALEGEERPDILTKDGKTWYVPGTTANGCMIHSKQGQDWEYQGPTYYAMFRLKIDDNSGHVPIASLRVHDVTSYPGRMLVDKLIYTDDFVASGQYPQPGSAEEFEYYFSTNPTVLLMEKTDSTSTNIYDLLPEGHDQTVKLLQSGYIALDFEVYYWGNEQEIGLSLDRVDIQNSSGNSLLDGNKDNLLNTRIANGFSADNLDPTVRGFYADEPRYHAIAAQNYVRDLIGDYVENMDPPLQQVFDSRPTVKSTVYDTYLFHQYLNAGALENQDHKFIVNRYPFRTTIPEAGDPGYNTALQDRWENYLIPVLDDAQYVAGYNNREFWYALQTQASSSLRDPSPIEIKAMVWLGLAYGAKGIFYYTYGSTDEFFGLVDEDFDHDVEPYKSKWDTVQVINNNLQILAPELLELEWLNAFTINHDAIPSGSFVQGMDYGDDVEAANFTHPVTGENYFMLMNRRCESSDIQTINIHLQNAPTQRRLIEDVLASRTEWKGNLFRVAYRILEPGETTITITLLPGEGRLFRVTDGLSGSLGGERYWSGQVLLKATLIVEAGETLHIGKGAQIRIEGKNSLFIRANGNCTAVGTVSQPILFTSADGTTPSSWKYVYINGSSNFFKHCIFEYGYWSVFLRGYPSPASYNYFEDCIVKDSNQAVRIRFSSGYFMDCQIQENGYGIVSSEGSSLISISNRVNDNAQNGIYGLGTGFYGILCSVFENNGQMGSYPGISMSMGDVLYLGDYAYGGYNTVRNNGGHEIWGGWGSPTIHSIVNSIHDISGYELVNDQGNPAIYATGCWFGEYPPNPSQFSGPMTVEYSMTSEPSWEGETDCSMIPFYEQNSTDELLSRLEPQDKLRIQKLKKTILDTELEGDAVVVLHELYAILRRDFFENRFGEKEQFFSFLQN
ncbi:right-handed parallel beta-helix repeat-containing protein, partial [candidate division KSB1 bacterium]|nr:right-handed parallel beta-helix repeat-containing protein [candidate division KSB1 bacterium]